MSLGPDVAQPDPSVPQQAASDPNVSAWVSANAGSGKTRVLVSRVLRLLLGGVPPGRILCLTYTKAAAAEMSNRVQAAVAAWSHASPAALAKSLEELLGRAPDAAELALAPRLFFMTLDAPTGLRIHTIHSFCERLLQRFPLEAGLAPNFAVLDETEAQGLLQRAIDATLTEAAGTPATPLGEALDFVIGECGERRFLDMIREALMHRDALETFIRRSDPESELKGWRQGLSATFAVRTGRTRDALLEEISDEISDPTLDAAISALSLGKATDIKFRNRLMEARRAATLEQRVGALRRAFLRDQSQPYADGSIVTKQVKDLRPDLAAELFGIRDRIATLTTELRGHNVIAASQALFRLTSDILGRYRLAKDAESALDYDDLIDFANRLLDGVGAAAWVLFKLDEGLDHILIDEAQDTNPRQWRVVERLAEEFFAGSGARDGGRTIFAVGDEKQSIFSFQGADPDRFVETGLAFERRAREVGSKLVRVPLTVSFRSTPPVLDAVDAVFARPEAFSGLISADACPDPHVPFRTNLPGLIELWDPETEEEPGDPEPMDPLADMGRVAKASDRLADRIAATIQRWLETGERLEAENRPMRPGDILILLRQRKHLSSALIRALKTRRVEVAGADRMRLAEQIAVMDLMGLGDFLLMPEDDLSLAAVLKSPMFGLDDDDLFRLAHGRKASLWAALLTRAGESARFAEAASRLRSWLARADLSAPYEFYAGVLGEENERMRARLIGRLGPEAADAIDEFLREALVYDRLNPPSLQGFLDLMRGGGVEVKRDMEQARDEVRVMTVHGAKGLEANVVILPDTCGMAPANPSVFSLAEKRTPDGYPPIWCPAGHVDLAPIRTAKDRIKDAGDAEHRRLLYVAMTRARERLYVCGHEGARKRPKGCWYNLIDAGLADRLQPVALADGTIVRRYAPPAAVPALTEVMRQLPLPPMLPQWAHRPAPAERRDPLRAPSGLFGLDADAALAEPPPLGPLALARDARFARGRLIHSLLQHLPEAAPETRVDRGTRLAARLGRHLDASAQAEAVRETLAVLDHPAFAALFVPGSRAEVSVVGRLGEGVGSIAVSGQIDRLVVTDEAVLMVDYKTNRPPPRTAADAPLAYVAQLAAYRGVLARLFTDRPVRAHLLWTDGPRLMEIPAEMLDAAERRILASGGDLDATCCET